MGRVDPLSAEQRHVLEHLRRCAVGAVAERAQMVLLSGRGYRAAEIADVYAVSVTAVRKWLRRYRRDGPDGLYESGEPSRPPSAQPAPLRGDCPWRRRRGPRWTVAALATVLGAPAASPEALVAQYGHTSQRRHQGLSALPQVCGALGAVLVPVLVTGVAAAPDEPVARLSARLTGIRRCQVSLDPRALPVLGTLPTPLPESKTPAPTVATGARAHDVSRSAPTGRYGRPKRRTGLPTPPRPALPPGAGTLSHDRRRLEQLQPLFRKLRARLPVADLAGELHILRGQVAHQVGERL